VHRLALFASGGGSNVQAILDYHAALGATAPFVPTLVVTDRPRAGVVARAAQAGVECVAIERPADGTALHALLERRGITLIALAGYLKFVPAEVTSHWRGALINVHPSLLPAFGGPGMYGHRVHEAVIAAGVRESGATVHFVDEVYDRGAVIGQARVPVRSDDSADTLAARVLAAEHALYPRALHALALGLVSLDADGHARIVSELAQHPSLLPSPVALDFAVAPTTRAHH
jgi:formyltetrahydrofolate-dependent phosphoribosylglycinamide formyltransferase